ncbi:TPA: hypothetical protein ACNHRR_005537, partial [Escherichia coli]
MYPVLGTMLPEICEAPHLPVFSFIHHSAPHLICSVLHDGLLHERKTLYQGTAHRVVGTISLTMEVEILKEAVEYAQSRKTSQINGVRGAMRLRMQKSYRAS